ncbi:MAG TPA: LolA-related protein [Steroidobacteraceae bacterium]|jgi:hypothetical protein
MRMLAAIVLAMSTCCSAAQPAPPAGLTLDQLMSSLAQRKHGEVSFAETDYLALLDRPVKSSGVLVYQAPAHLEKRTLLPRRESLVLDGDQLTVQRGHRTYQMQMSAYPQVAPYVDAIRDTLAGNAQALEKVFTLSLTGGPQDWKLQLVPLDPGVARKLKQVTISGAQDVIRSVETLQADGDHSVMTLAPPQ